MQLGHLSIDQDWLDRNGNITLEAFRSSKFVFAGRQRDGVSQIIDELKCPATHIRRAMDLVSPFEEDIPLPNDVGETIDISKKVDVNDMPSSWKRRIDLLLLAKKSVACECKSWYNATPPSIKGATGVIDVPLWPYLIRAFGLGCHTWMAQFVFGFPIVGDSGQNRLFSPSVDEVLTPADSPNPCELFYTAKNQFKTRAKPMNATKSQLLRGEACDQRLEGWLASPGKLSDR